jgi:gamma-glutamylcyclotransferase (GGCT)/AIG2-like uncharacterized protein YtfP
MNRNLFVYGSLLSGAGHPMGERLRREARLIGEAAMQGQLYKISWYPGLVEAGDASLVVHGEVYALNSPSATLKWLDAYEGIGSGRPDHDYQRVERTVRLQSGGTLSAWVYVYQKSIAGLRPIQDGRWLSSGSGPGDPITASGSRTA